MLGRARQRFASAEGTIKEGVAKEPHRPLQLLAEVAGGEHITAVNRTGAPLFEAGRAGPGQPQTAFVMAGVGHEVGGSGPAAQPGCHHWNHIPHHQDQLIPAGDPQQQQQAPQEIEHLPLDHLGDAADHAGVAQAAGAVLTRAAANGDPGLLIGTAMAHQR